MHTDHLDNFHLYDGTMHYSDSGKSTCSFAQMFHRNILQIYINGLFNYNDRPINGLATDLEK